MMAVAVWLSATGCYAREVPVVEPASDFLHAAVRVNNPSASCGTIIGAKGTKIYVLSTGHMEKRTKPEIEIFYRGGARLKTPLVLKGRTVFLVENGLDNGLDFSLIEVDVGELTNFSHVPVAPLKHNLQYKTPHTSIGCDLGVEPREFEAKPSFKRTCDFVTEGEVQPGRSGGGLFDRDDKKLVGVCWGGSGSRGLFTSHVEICTLLRAARYGFLTDGK